MPFPFDGFEVEPHLRPSQGATGFDLTAALSAVVALEAEVPRDAATAATLGTERIGNGVVIGDNGLVLTIGYLLIEAERVVLTTYAGRKVEGHVLGTDPVTGFGLVQALEPLEAPKMALGDPRRLRVGASVVVAGAGGLAHASVGRVIARDPFAGYWEYYLDDAIFTAPAHPHWSGAALIGAAGELLGVGSLNVQGLAGDGQVHSSNMFVPTDLLPPILEDLAAGRAAHPPRPWLGVISQDMGDQVVVMSVSPGSPAARAELKAGDTILAVAGVEVSSLAEFYAALWASGAAGVAVPLKVEREGDQFTMEVRSADRQALMKTRRLN